MPAYPSNGTSGWDSTLKTFLDETTTSVSVQSYGATGNGSTDDATAINAAATAAASLGLRLVAKGTFLIGSTVTIACNADLSGATFNYTGTGVAVSIGSTTSGTVVNRLAVKLPSVIFANKPGIGWTASTIGVRLANLFSCRVDVAQIQGFEDGLEFLGTGTGCVYNTVIVQHLDDNKRNMRFTADSTGWANQNTIVGGRFSHNSAEGTQVAGTRHVLMDNTTNLVNNNTFWGCSLESPNVVEYHIECYGWDNTWNGCRFENTTTANTRVFWRAGSRGNLVHFGFGTQNIVEVVEAGSANTANSVQHKYQARMFGTGTQSALVLENNSASTSAVARVMEAGAYSASADPTTAYAWEWTAQKLNGKRAADATGSPRISLDPVNGYGRFSTAVQVARVITAGRPAAATAGAGAMVLDSTLNKPVWSDGTNWRDATGTIV